MEKSVIFKHLKIQKKIQNVLSKQFPMAEIDVKISGALHVRETCSF